MEKFDIIISSPPEGERPVAEIAYGYVQWAEVSQSSDGELVVEFYPHPKRDYWEFEFEETIQILEEARNELLRAMTVGSFEDAF